MEAMDGLRTVQTAILEMLDRDELPTRSDARAPEPRRNGSTTTTQSSPRPVRYGSPERRRAVKTLILRYRDEKKLDELPDAELRDEVTNFLQHFDYNKIPTARIPELYFEAMAHHGPYLLGVDGFVAAWHRIVVREVGGHEQLARQKKPTAPNCKACGGTRQLKRAVPIPGVPMWVKCTEAVAECVYCVPVSTEIVKV